MGLCEVWDEQGYKIFEQILKIHFIENWNAQHQTILEAGRCV